MVAMMSGDNHRAREGYTKSTSETHASDTSCRVHTFNDHDGRALTIRVIQNRRQAEDDAELVTKLHRLGARPATTMAPTLAHRRAGGAAVRPVSTTIIENESGIRSRIWVRCIFGKACGCWGRPGWVSRSRIRPRRVPPYGGRMHLFRIRLPLYPFRNWSRVRPLGFPNLPPIRLPSRGRPSPGRCWPVVL